MLGSARSSTAEDSDTLRTRARVPCLCVTANMTSPFVAWRGGTPRVGGPALLLLSALGYFACACFAYTAELRPAGIVVVWVGSGFMLACLLLSAPRAWPFLLAGGALGNLAADLLAGNSLMLGIGGSTANAIESWCAAWVVMRLVKPPITLTTVRQVTAFALGGVVASNALTALLGSAVLSHGFQTPSVTAWLTWWTADGLGMLLVTPVIVGSALALSTPAAMSWRRAVEGGLGIAGLIVLSSLVLHPVPSAKDFLRIDPYVLLPLLLMAVIRFGSFGGALATMAVAVVTAWQTTRGRGVFSDTGYSVTSQLFRIYIYLFTAGLTTLFGAAMLNERERAHQKIRTLAREAAFRAEKATALAEEEDLSAALRQVADAMVRHLDVAVAQIWLVDQPKSALRLTAAAGLVTHPNQVIAEVPIGQSRIGRIAAERHPHITNDIARDRELHDASWAIENGLVSFAGHPLIVNDRVVGVMTVLARHALPTSTTDVLASAASTIALAIERKRVEAQISLLGRAIESTNEMISVTDLDDRFIFVNHSFLRAYGYRQDEVIGQTPAIIHGRTVPREVVDELLRASRGQGWQGELVNRRKDGTELTVSLSTSPIHDRQGRIVGLLGVARDVTEHRKLEDHLRQAEKIEAAGQLASGLAHDFNNVLTIISGYEDLLHESTGEDDARRADIEEIQHAGQRAAHLTRQLLTFSRRQIVQPVLLNLNHLIDDIMRMLRPLVGENVRLDVRLDPQLALVKADLRQIEHVLINLAVNARDAMPLGGTLTIETSNVPSGERALDAEPSAGPRVLLSVGDTGAGMSADTMKRIFEPFFTTKGEGKGTGLGLATVLSIVQQSGGTITADSMLGTGTTFRIYLPQAAAELGTESRPFEAPAPHPGDRTILVVDDEKAVLQVVRSVLEKEGYKVLVADDPRTAINLSAAHGSSIDLVLTDVIMPGMAGPQLFDSLRSQRPGLRVLYMSGYAGEAIAAQGVLDPNTPLIDKPFTMAGLTRAVREVLNKT